MAIATETPIGALNGRAWGTLLVLCGALFLDGLDVSMKSVALPAIGADLGMSTAALQWVVSGYSLGFAGFLLLGGRAADLLGRRRIFLGSLAAFLIASAVGGAAPAGWVLIVTRFVTGVSAAFTAPAGLSIITTSFTEGYVRNKALSVYTATGASGFALGMVGGGLLTGLSWRWVFFVPVLLAGLTLAGAVRLVPADRSPARRSGFDVAGAVAVTAALLLLVYTLAAAPRAGWASPRTLCSFVAVAVLLATFVGVERRSATPLIQLRLLRSPSLIRANVGAMALLGGWVGALFVMTLYMQEVRGWSALTAGLAVAPAGVVVAVAAPRVAAPLVGRFGTAPVILAGLTAATGAYLLLLLLAPRTSYPTVMLPAFLLVGVAFTLAYGPLTMAATTGVPPAEQGVAAGVVNTSFQLGPALLLAVVTAVDGAYTRSGTSPDALLSGLHAALTVPLAVSLVGVVATATGLAR